MPDDHTTDLLTFGTWKLPSKPEHEALSLDAGLMLVQRRRRWASIKPTPSQRQVFAGLPHNSQTLLILY